MALSKTTAPRAATPPVRDEAIEADRLIDRILRLGVVVAVVAVVIQITSQLVNYFVFDGEIWNLNLDGEGNVFAWASSVTQFAAAFCCGLLVLEGWWSRRRLVALMLILAFFSLDDIVQLHERLTLSFIGDALGIERAYSRVVWPLLFFPLLGAAFVLLWRLAERAPRQATPLVRIGLAMLVLAVGAEAFSTLLHVGEDGYGTLQDTLLVAFEETLELGAWVVITAALAATFYGAVYERARRAG